MRAYVRPLGRSVSVWEVGNELNGNWTGDYGHVAAKTRAAFSIVRAAGMPTAITLYANGFAPDNCGDGRRELTPLQFARRFLSPALRARLDYLLLSYYPTQCDGVEPTADQVRAHLLQLHALFPHARLGFGETGLPEPVRATTARRARQIMRWAYSLDPRLRYYARGYFWWNAAEDALWPGAVLRAALANALLSEHAALGGRPKGPGAAPTRTDTAPFWRGVASGR